jgi:hypothetical protein
VNDNEKGGQEKVIAISTDNKGGRAVGRSEGNWMKFLGEKK